MKRLILVSAIVIAFLCPACTQAAIVYEVIDLGTLGGDSSEAKSINDAGQIVGGAQDNQGDWYATLFDSTGAGNNINLGDVGTFGDVDFSTLAISNNGASQIVGYDLDATIYGGRKLFYSAVLFDTTGAGDNIRLGSGIANSINDAGQTVGSDITYTGEPPYYLDRAVLFDATGSGYNIDLGTLGGDQSGAYSINNNGHIVGWAYNSHGDQHATLFDPTGAGNNLDLGIMGGDWSSAVSINGAGQIVGWSGWEHLGTVSVYHAILFDPTGAGNNIDLGTLGGDRSEAISINEAGQIVGRATNSQDWERATLFDPTGAGNNIDLNTLIDPASGWILERAYDINNSGWIVGEGINPQGERHAFLLIPEPATFALLGLGFLLLRRKE
ncbi:MAG: PEP-CTERM sorting domain-containing protein [Planctomycetota bacterium]|jgi:probable HAF family extracellular repeat protein